MKKGWRIKPVYSGKGTAVTQYKVVDENGTLQFQGDYTECYYVLFPDAESNYLDYEAYEKVNKL